MPVPPNLTKYLRQILLKPDVLGSLIQIAGDALVADDILDLGWGSYRREDRPYHKDTAPGLHPGREGDHPQSIHHWHVGMLLQLVGASLQGLGKKRPEGPK